MTGTASTIDNRRLRSYLLFMLIALPDNSAVVLEDALRITQYDPQAEPSAAQRQALETDDPALSYQKIAKAMSSPCWKFGDSFRRVSDYPCYSPKQSVHQFDVCFGRIYEFPRSGSGSMFNSSTSECEFLDGGIISHIGYGWGSNSWTVVEGAEALRAVCLFFGITQPQRIKGEPPRRRLAELLDEMTEVPLRDMSQSSYGVQGLLDSLE